MRSAISIKVRQRGKDTGKFLKQLKEKKYYSVLEAYARRGVDLLREATPRDTGLTAASWYYEIEITDDRCVVHWSNSNIQNGINIALILQMGHGTGTGGWVEGRDYINPAMQPLFDEMAEACWGEVTKL